MKKLILSIFFVFAVCFNAFAATKYARAGGGNWNTDATWSTSSGGAADTTACTSADDCLLDANSGNVTIAATAAARSVDCTGYTGTLTHNAGITLSIGDGTAGAGNVALKFVAGMTYTLGNAATSAISFITTSATQQTVTWGGKTAGNVTFNASSNGDWAIVDNMTTGSTATVTLTKGTLHVDGAADNSGLTHSWGTFDSNNSNTRSLNLGASTINISLSGSGRFQLAASTTASSVNLTLTAGTSTIGLNNGTSSNNFGNNTFNIVNVTTNGTFTMGNGTFSTLSITGAASKIEEFQLSGNFTVTGTLVLAGNSAINRLFVTTNSLGSTRVITNSGATMTWSNVGFRYITLGTAFDASAITGGSGDAGGNSGITFTSAATKYWVGNGGNWSDPTNHWATSSGGSPGAGNIPLPQDDVVFDANSFSSGSQTVTSDMPRVGKNINWTGATNSPTLTISTARTVYGSITLISGMTLGAGSGTTFEGRGSFTLTSAGKSWASPTIQMIGGTLTLQDAFTATGTVTLNNGTLDANNFNVTTANFSSSNSNTRVITMGSGTWTLTGTGTVWTISTATNLTLNANTSTILISDTSGSSKILAVSNKSYNNINISNGGSGTVVFSGTNSTFNVFTINAPKTVRFVAGHTFNIASFIATGSSSDNITLNTDSAGSPATLSDSSGENNCFYCSIKDITAAGGANFTAIRSTDVSGNTGWRFRKNYAMTSN